MSATAKREAWIAKRKQTLIAALALLAIACHLLLRAVAPAGTAVLGLAPPDFPLVVALALGGTPLVLGLLVKLVRREFGSDLLAGISIVTSVCLAEPSCAETVQPCAAAGCFRVGGVAPNREKSKRYKFC